MFISNRIPFKDKVHGCFSSKDTEITHKDSAFQYISPEYYRYNSFKLTHNKQGRKVRWEKVKLLTKKNIRMLRRSQLIN